VKNMTEFHYFYLFSIESLVAYACLFRFTASVAVEMLVLVNSVCAWYTCMRCEEQEAIGSPAQYRAYASLDDDGSPNSAPDLAALES
jgi:hypothetical protein